MGGWQGAPFVLPNSEKRRRPRGVSQEAPVVSKDAGHRWKLIGGLEKGKGGGGAKADLGQFFISFFFDCVNVFVTDFFGSSMILSAGFSGLGYEINQVEALTCRRQSFPAPPVPPPPPRGGWEGEGGSLEHLWSIPEGGNPSAIEFFRETTSEE